MPQVERGGVQPPASARRGQREIYFEALNQHRGGGWATAEVYARDALLAGNQVVGPAAIEEVSATTVLYPGDRATVHVSGSLLVTIGS
jgi:N-methylhydantoinase A